MIPQPAQASSASEPTAVTVIIPCLNEEEGLLHLKSKLHLVRLLLEERYTLHFIFVDDGSTDRTWSMMNALFQRDANCTLLRHSGNLGIGAAIMSGIRAARTEIVCSIDSDCTYDPCELERMLPLLTPDVDLVTASPYHPAGLVCGVPRWRVFLSKAASRLYRRVLRQKLCTYTSCFRVYRRSAILRLKLRRRGFLAVAELIGNLDLHGAVVVECPATLTSRSYGASKMRTARAAIGHLQLIGELLVYRVCRALFPRRRARMAMPDFNESRGLRI